jgi:hypothetical protein
MLAEPNKHEHKWIKNNIKISNQFGNFYISLQYKVNRT